MKKKEEILDETTNTTTTTLEYIVPAKTTPCFIPDEAENSEEDSMAMIKEMIGDLIKVELDTSDLDGIKLEKKDFIKGIKEVSKLAGMYSCLSNVGMSEDAILTYILNERNIEHSQTMQKVINEGQIEMAKTQSKTMALQEDLHTV